MADAPNTTRQPATTPPAAQDGRAAGDEDPHQKGWLRRLSPALATAGVVVGLLASLTSVTDWVRGLFSGPEAPAVISASIPSVRLDSTGETLRDYLATVKRPATGARPEALEEEGYVFTVRLRIRGEGGRLLTLHWSMYKAAPRRRLRDPLFNQRVLTVEPRNQDHSRNWPVWVPNPPNDGTYVLRFVLLDAQGQEVASKVSGTFAYRSAPAEENA